MSSPYKLLDRWRRRHTMLGVISVLVFAALLVVISNSGLANPGFAIIAGVLGLLGILYIFRMTLPTLEDTLQLAHHQNPAIEFSGQLLLDNDKASGLKLIQARLRMRKEGLP